MEVQIVLTGPEGSGKSTFVQQLKSIYETRSLVWPAANLIKISPTTGKEIFTVSLENGRIVNRALAKEWVRSEVGFSRRSERLLRRWENTPVSEFDPILPQIQVKQVEGDAALTACVCERQLPQVVGASTRPPLPKAQFYPPIVPSITMAAVTSLQRNNNNDTTHRAGQSGNMNTFSVVDHTMDSSAFVSPPPPGAGELVSVNDVNGTSRSKDEEIMTRKDYKLRQVMEAEKLRAEGAAEAGAKEEKYDRNAAQGDRVDFIRKIFPDDDQLFRRFIVEVHEIGGRMLSVLPKFMTRLNLSGEGLTDGPEGLFIFMIDLTNPSQIPTSAIELSYIRHTYLRQTKTARRRWCIVANKCMSLLSAGVPPVGHGRVAGASVLSGGGVDAAEIALMRHRVKQLLAIPDHPDFTDSDDEEDTACDSSNRSTIVLSADGSLKRPAVREDLMPPIFIVDTWTGTGFGDFIAWLEDR